MHQSRNYPTRNHSETVPVTPLESVTGPADVALSVDGIVKLVPIVLLLVTIPLLARWIGAVWVVPSKRLSWLIGSELSCPDHTECSSLYR